MSLGRRADRLGNAFFDERIPRAAVATAPLPLRGLRTALLTNEYRLRLLHRDHKRATETPRSQRQTQKSDFFETTRFVSQHQRAPTLREEFSSLEIELCVFSLCLCASVACLWTGHRYSLCTRAPRRH